MRFSQIFGLNADQAQLDFVDIEPASDNPLFIDPFALSIRNDAWSESCHTQIRHFFQTAIDRIRAGKIADAKSMLNGLSEPNETCLGLSVGEPAGRGVAGKQALDLYESLAESEAAKSGLIEQLAECDLFVPGIGSDKISDITTNIIRLKLIEYTVEQCKLHNLTLVGTYPSGKYWDMQSQSWQASYLPFPIVNGKRIILVPKYSVRMKLALNSQEFYSHHILNFIQETEFAKGQLVRTLRTGEKRPETKKFLRDRFPFSKDFLARFSQANPQVLRTYKQIHEKLDSAKGTLTNGELDENFDEALLARALIARLQKIPPGTKDESVYHSFIVGCLEFIFWPNLIYPRKEDRIHDGRKRIDITYTNAARDGFFERVHTAHKIASNLVMVECKNYSKDPKNPEIDQLAGRFSPNRGKLGMLTYRTVSDYDLLLARCRDTAIEDKGFMLPLGDQQIVELLTFVVERKRSRIDGFLEGLLHRLIT